MARMKISRYFVLLLLLTVSIFLIPFFWLKPGEMDLGGDNSRLYFYDPLSYLTSQSLYSVSHSGLGGENLSYYAIPFILLLALVKSLVHSPTILISLFHGLNMSLGFISCYLVVKELLKREEDARKEQVIIEAASILAGLFYTFSPIPIGWWGYPLLTMNLIFLNPLLFFLLLRFFLTNSIHFLFLALLVTFFFAPNFSFIGAPTFFAFFPLAVLFLLLYTKGIKKRPIPIVKIAIGLLLFIIIHAFHLFPQIASILTSGSAANQALFGAFGKFEWGLKYFLGTAPIIKVSNSLLSAPQFGKPEFYAPAFIVFPLLFVLGFLWNKSRLYLLTAIFFFITLFLVTANITTIGFKLYVLAFQLPGFSMFRVFYGQWAWAYLFFYTVLIGLALATVLPKIKKMQRYLFIGFIVILFIATSWPLISGKLTDTTHWQSKGIKSHVKMDPAYEDVLAYLRSLPVDGKILSFPLNDHGYQVLKGENNAAYVGPSTITYVAARNEFNSVAEFGDFGLSILTAAREKNFTTFKEILTMLNIKYIFYNEDPFIYSDNYPGLPYTQVRDFFPDTQEGYKEFIKNLGVKEIKSFGWKYHIYELDDTSYIPHVYMANENVYWNDLVAVNLHNPLSFYPEDRRVALYDDINIFKKYKTMFDDVFLKARNTSTIFDFFKKKKEDKFVSPTISRKLSDLIYPLVVVKEKRDIARFTTINDAYVDRSIYFAEKRVNELVKLEHIPLRRDVVSITELGSTWEEPKLFEFTRYNEYNSWEVTMVRYQRAIEKLVVDLEKADQSAYSLVTSKVELKNYLKKHKSDLRTAIRQESLWGSEDRQYISSLLERMFTDIFVKLNLQLPDFNHTPYSLEYPLEEGQYEVYVHKEDTENLDIKLSTQGQPLAQKNSEYDEWMRYEDVVVYDASSLPIILSIDKIPNLIAQTRWNVAELPTYSSWIIAEETSDPITLIIPYNFLENTSGVVRDIPQWEEDSIYTISFDYLTSDRNFSVILHERGGTKSKQYLSSLYEETFRSNEWKKLNIVVQSSKNAKMAYLQIVRAQDDYEDPGNNDVKKIEIKNLVVQKIYNPRIVFKKVVTRKDISRPSLTFTMINPTKYKVIVSGAVRPYTLVFSQAFNQKWKLFFPSGQSRAKTFRGVFTRPAGQVLSAVTKRIVPNGKDSFWNADTFETWGYDPIAEATHLPVNGYANAWYITPEDVGNARDYELIIEMTSQKLFLGSLFLSTGAFFLVLFVLVFSLTKIRK
ncbi:hypothetical protein HY409_01275 [Candidatus Gottesmanbacteria bacterium]|nr:hypothetical protein [Candidatus Gottesmanbacteria bacterium]